LGNRETSKKKKIQWEEEGKEKEKPGKRTSGKGSLRGGKKGIGIVRGGRRKSIIRGWREKGKKEG